MSAFSHDTEDDHGGELGEDVTELQVGSPERLHLGLITVGVL